VFSEPFTPNLAIGILLIIVAVTLIILSKSIQSTLRKIYRAARLR
ncbi:EamA/RhaT family transporter, partial [Parabacteroides johnsonii]|nr:EamA/RhaT family transporter [Parabacteroides johnsonii]MDC7160103.1 EamA/RhaT family transporter [Parabacteroides johnsonii]